MCSKQCEHQICVLWNFLLHLLSALEMIIYRLCLRLSKRIPIYKTIYKCLNRQRLVSISQHFNFLSFHKFHCIRLQKNVGINFISIAVHCNLLVFDMEFRLLAQTWNFRSKAVAIFRKLSEISNFTSKYYVRTAKVVRVSEFNKSKL